MNEHIRKMAEEHFDVRDGVIVSPVDGYVDIEEELQKFAELIIQDCIEQVKLELRNHGQLLSNPPQNAGVWDACNNIRRHFGAK